jgi:hypothetical protein
MKKEQLLKHIFDFFGVTSEEIEGSSRELRIVQARHVFLIAFKLVNNKISYYQLAKQLPWSSYGNLRHYFQQYIESYPIRKTVDLFMKTVEMPNLGHININKNLFKCEITDILTIEDFNYLLENLKK